MIKSILPAICLTLLMSSCLKTRSDLGESYQSQVYSKKQAENQKQNSLEPSESVARVDERDELIRNLNGRIEVLENQLLQLQKEKQENTDTQKVQILQETLVKMEAQIAKLEQEASVKSSDQNIQNQSSSKNSSSDKTAAHASSTTSAKKEEAVKNSFDVAQEFFAKKDYKSAILEYQKYVDSHSKTKSKLIPEAKYKIGLCFEALGLKDEAYSFYEEVAAQYAKTEFGKKAKQKISKSKK